MRIPTALAVALAAAVALPANAAPRGTTFNDAAGDANFLDGANGTGSQASFDILKVRLVPFERTKKSSGVTVAIDLGAAPSTTPGTSYTFSTTQWGCTLTVSRTITAEGVSANKVTTCGHGSVGASHGIGGTRLVTIGKTIMFDIPADDFFDSSLGAGLKDIEVSTAVGDPGAGLPAPRRVDRALSPKTYRLGS